MNGSIGDGGSGENAKESMRIMTRNLVHRITHQSNQEGNEGDQNEEITPNGNNEKSSSTD